VKAFRILKTVFIQLGVFLVLVAIVNWAAGEYLKRKGQTNREALPNYSKDYPHAKQIFADYNAVQHEYEPFVGWKMRAYNGQTLTVSADGERVIPKTTCDAGDPMSVHFFGGSTMWGEGSDDDNTIPALFQTKNPQFQVFNHGQLAYNSRQELDALISLYATDNNPDVVIFYDGVNDAAFLCPKEITELPAHRLVPMYREKLYAGKSGLMREVVDKVFLENILKITRKVSSSKSNSSPYDCVSNPEKADQIANIMIRNWEIAHDLVTQRNGKFLAVLQPAAYIGKPRTDHLELDADLGENFQAIYSRLKEKIKSKNYPWVIDLTDKFDGDEYIYIDFCHVSPNGNEIIASEITKTLRPSKPIKEDVSLLAIHP
jgi:hypothetical protein